MIKPAPPPYTVLFLCTGNYYRSRYAEIAFNHLAPRHGLPWTAESRGLDLALGVNNVGPLSVFTRSACQSRGFVLPDPLRMPLALCAEDLRLANLTIALKELEHRAYLARRFPEWVDRVRYWHVHDLDRAPAEHALLEIDRLVGGLVTELVAAAAVAAPPSIVPIRSGISG